MSRSKKAGPAQHSVQIRETDGPAPLTFARELLLRHFHPNTSGEKFHPTC